MLNISYPDSDTTAIKILNERFCIRGTGISVIFKNILDCFSQLATFENVVAILSGKHSATAIKRLFDFMVDKKLLIDESFADLLVNCDIDLIEKTMFYTMGGEHLNQIIRNISKLKIGIIATNQIAYCLLNCFTKSGIIAEFFIGITDCSTGLQGEYVNLNLTEFPLYNDLSNIQAIVDASDFVLVASNFQNHEMFEEVNKICYKKGMKWLRIMIDGSKAEVGPLFLQNKTCCYSCLRTRAKRNMSNDEIIFDNMNENHRTREDSMVFCSLYPINHFVSAIVCVEIMKYITDLKCNTINQVLMVDFLNLSIDKHYVYKDFTCPVCGQKEVLNT